MGEHVFGWGVRVDEMNRRDWLNLFVALEGAPDGLDPVRIQNGLFLFAMQADVPSAEKYRFKPYDYGPMSVAVYSDLDALVRDRLVSRKDVPGKRWGWYRATEAGLRAGTRTVKLAQIEGHLSAAQTLHRIKRRVAELPFNELLPSVYKDYPKYATNSVFRRSA